MNPPARTVISRRFPVPAERVFDAWLDPEWIGRWMYGPAGGGEHVVRLGLEPRVGGKFSFVVSHRGVEAADTGAYLEIDRPGLLVFTWGPRDSLSTPGRVIVEISPCTGGCELTLTQVGVAGPAGIAANPAGAWSQRLGALAGAFADTHPLTVNSS